MHRHKLSHLLQTRNCNHRFDGDDASVSILKRFLSLYNYGPQLSFRIQRQLRRQTFKNNLEPVQK